MLGRLLTEQANPSTAEIDRLPVDRILGLIHEEDLRVAAAITPSIPSIALAVEGIERAIRGGGRLFYIGAGTSGRLGVLDAAECPPTFNVPPDLVQGVIAGGEQALISASEGAEDDAAAGPRDLAGRAFDRRDALVGISASGRTPYVLGAVAWARGMGAFTAGVSCAPDSELSRSAEVAITLVTGPEVIAGSTRMKAGTATKMALNMISTAVMVRLGYVYGNLMVNVRPTSEKLRARACRIVSSAGRVSRRQAAELLRQTGGDVRTAIVMARLEVGPQEARARLEAAGGRVAEALFHG